MVMHDTVPAGQVGDAAYRAMFEHTSEGVLFSLADGRITAANPAACNLLDLEAETICRLGLDGVFDQEDPRWSIGVAERERSGAWVGVARLRRGDGRIVDMEVTTKRFEDAHGVVRVLSILHDIAGLAAIEHEMEELKARLLEVSRADELTGFQNRRGFLVAGNRLLQWADRRHEPVQMLFAHVENVAELNDRLGLHAGDAALQAVARSLKVAFRPHDVLARIGGTQFVALAFDLGEPELAAVTRRIGEHLAAADTVAFVGAELAVSFGWATRPAGERSTLEVLVARADWAMLEAREARRAPGSLRRPAAGAPSGDPA
jgi:diguanylate cyclase (GGDEF)-like protein/PAS domain S-box-containing protein